MSLEYSMFRFSDDYPTAEGLSEMVMQMCMNDERNSDQHTAAIRSLVTASHLLRYAEKDESSGDDDVYVPIASQPGELFMEYYTKACKKIGEHCDSEDAWWEDWWPIDCPWHPNDIARLARLKAGQTQAVRRQLREMWADKEATNAKD